MDSSRSKWNQRQTVGKLPKLATKNTFEDFQDEKFTWAYGHLFQHQSLYSTISLNFTCKIRLFSVKLLNDSLFIR